MIKLLNQLFDLCDDITVNSNQVKKKSLFVAYQGHQFDGRNFIDSAIKSGAAAIIYEKKNFEWKPEWNIPHMAINELKKELPIIANKFYGNPSKSFKLIGVTGTNGKTTSTVWLSSCLNQLKIKAGYVGTLGYGDNINLFPTSNTTPDVFSTQKILQYFKAKKASHIAMEVSSHAIDQKRIDTLEFDIKVLTNITRDHLDYHGSIENYIKCKTSFLLEKPLSVIIINNDDPAGKIIAEQIKTQNKTPKLLTFGLENNSDLMAKKISFYNDRVAFDLHHKDEIYRFEAPIFGKYNLYNLMGVIGCLLKLEINIKDIQSVVLDLPQIEGRAEVIMRNDNNEPIIIIDYAHTPDALRNILETIKQHNSKKLTVLFGCGGNRDQGKRKEMAIIANQWADKAIITSDNPRDESPVDIIEEISRHINIPLKKFEKRDAAIKYAVEGMSSNDILLIAGKGHECYQEIKGKKYPFSDKNIALKVLEKIKK